MSPEIEKTQVRRARTMGSLWMVLLTVFLFVLFRYSQEMISLVTGIPMDQIADMGPEVIQRSLVAAFNLTFAVLFAAVLAAFVENQLKPDAFGAASRWGILFITFCLSYSLLAT